MGAWGVQGHAPYYSPLRQRRRPEGIQPEALLNVLRGQNSSTRKNMACMGCKTRPVEARRANGNMCSGLSKPSGELLSSCMGSLTAKKLLRGVTVGSAWLDDADGPGLQGHAMAVLLSRTPMQCFRCVSSHESCSDAQKVLLSVCVHLPFLRRLRSAA